MPRQVSVAATEYLLSYNLAKTVEKFTGSCPAVRLNLRADLPRAVLRMVENGEAEIGITTYDRDEPRSPVLEYLDLFERQLHLLCSTGHPLARKKQIVPADLTAYPMIVPPRGSFSQRMLERLLQRHGLVEHIHVMMESRTDGRRLPLRRPRSGHRLCFTSARKSAASCPTCGCASSILSWKRFQSP